MTYPIQKRKVRVFTWIILAINVLMLAWLIKFIVNVAKSTKVCSNLSHDSCSAVKGIGGTIGSGVLIALWVALDIILGVLWLVTRKRQPQVVYINQAPPILSAGLSPVPSYATVRPGPQIADDGVASQPVLSRSPSFPRPEVHQRQQPAKPPSRAVTSSGGMHRGTGPGRVEVLVTTDQQMTFTCGGTWGRTLVIVDGVVLVDVSGAQTSYRVVRATGGPVHFDVDTEGTWTIYLRKATRGEARAS